MTVDPSLGIYSDERIAALKKEYRTTTITVSYAVKLQVYTDNLIKFLNVGMQTNTLKQIIDEARKYETIFLNLNNEFIKECKLNNLDFSNLEIQDTLAQFKERMDIIGRMLDDTAGFLGWVDRKKP